MVSRLVGWTDDCGELVVASSDQDLGGIEIREAG
jgi:hypothetical protein